MRHASTIAAALLVLSVAASGAVLWLQHTAAAAGRLVSDPMATAAEVFCFGVVGAVLVARRPDLPFGWILGLGAGCDIILVAIGVPSLALVDAGRGGQLAVWGVCVGVLQWVPTALQGIVNVRFPTGRPSRGVGHWLDRAMTYGIPIALVGTFLGDNVTNDLEDAGHPLPIHRVIDGTWVSPIGNAALVLVPLLILLGLLAGIGVIVRCVKASGVERQQLQWRAAGVAISLLLFPLAVSRPISSAYAAVGPLVFVSTLMIPLLRYQLWAGDPLPRRRRRVRRLVSRRTLIEAQEEERRRLRRDLHDGLGPLLTGLRLNLDAVQAQLKTDPDRALEHLATARQASAEVISDLRGLVYGLRPPALDELGLAGALQVHLATLVEGSTVEVNLDAAGDQPLPAAVEVAIYRSACEAVTNVVHHGTARQIRVVIATKGPDIVLTVDDDGIVSDTWHAGVGLTSMRERALELGGSFLASSGPSGFHVHVAYPRK